MKTSERLQARVLNLRATSIKLLFDAREYYQAYGAETWEEFRGDYEYLKRKIVTAYEHACRSKIGRKTIERLKRQGLDHWLSYPSS
ncbi:MAG: hypothetical protein AABX53_02235 [Nanoarchaeota archaeon]